MMHNLLTKVIRDTFLKEVGKCQKRNDEQQAFLVSFSTKIDYDKEEGYRQLDLLIYAPLNYVQVWTRDRWTVIDQEHLAYDEESDESYIKKGHDYDEGYSEWKLIGDHDSAWTSSIEHLLFENRTNLLTFETSEWYQVIPVPKEIIK